MQKSSGCRPSRFYAAMAMVVALFATSCSGGARPTLTGDRLVEPVESTTSAEAQDPVLGDGEEPQPVSEAEPAADPDSAADDDATSDTEAATSTDGVTSIDGVEQLSVQILETLPHDATAFTQGLELYDGLFIESTGLYGESEVRKVDPTTGIVQESVPVPDQFFAEGITRVDDQLIQLTWRENTAFYWDATTLELNSQVSYEGEGWGLCHDGSRLIMTDGTPTLIFRDPATFGELSRIAVTLDGQPVNSLNEVECVNGVVWANVWQTNLVVRIDPGTGEVTAVVDAMALSQANGAQGDVLNGIAWDETSQSFYMTGKLWPNMYRVDFAAAS